MALKLNPTTGEYYDDGVPTSGQTITGFNPTLGDDALARDWQSLVSPTPLMNPHTGQAAYQRDLGAGMGATEASPRNFGNPLQLREVLEKAGLWDEFSRDALPQPSASGARGDAAGDRVAQEAWANSFNWDALRGYQIGDTRDGYYTNFHLTTPDGRVFSGTPNYERESMDSSDYADLAAKAALIYGGGYLAANALAGAGIGAGAAASGGGAAAASGAPVWNAALAESAAGLSGLSSATPGFVAGATGSGIGTLGTIAPGSAPLSSLAPVGSMPAVTPASLGLTELATIGAAPMATSGSVNSALIESAAGQPGYGASSGLDGLITQNGSTAASGIDWGSIARDAAGNILPAVGDAVQGLTPALAALGTRQWMDMLSGGYFDQARELISQSGDAVRGVQGADLSSLIPTLRQQVMVGQMTPAQASAAYQSVVGTMTPASQQVFQAAVTGQMDAAQAVAALQADSAMQGVTSDQASLQGQRRALDRLAEMSERGGLTDADRAQMNAVLAETNANAASQRAAQIQQLQMQGLGGSGAELAARLSGVQGSANSNAQAGASLAQAAQARALAALQQGLQGNANLNTEQFRQDASRAQAQDAVNQFNAQARNTVAMQNAANQQNANQMNFQTANQIALANQAAQNAAAAANAQFGQQANQTNFTAAQQAAANNAQMAQQANMQNANNQQAANLTNFNTAQTIAGRNTDIANQQAMIPLTVGQQTFDNRLRQADTVARTNLTGANQLNAQGLIFSNAANANMVNTANSMRPTQNSNTTQNSGGNSRPGIGSTIGNAAGTYFGGPLGGTVGRAVGGLVDGLFSDERMKTDTREMTDEDIDRMFGDLTAYEYRYRGDRSNPRTAGVMAQDVERGPMRDSVVDTPNGKMLAGNEMFGRVLAAVSNHNDRLQRIEGKRK